MLYLTDFIDGYMASQLREIEGKPLQNVDDANLELPKDEAAETPEANQAGQEAFDQLVTRARERARRAGARRARRQDAGR